MRVRLDASALVAIAYELGATNVEALDAIAVTASGESRLATADAAQAVAARAEGIEVIALATSAAR